MATFPAEIPELKCGKSILEKCNSSCMTDKEGKQKLSRRKRKNLKKQTLAAAISDNQLNDGSSRPTPPNQNNETSVNKKLKAPQNSRGKVNGLKIKIKKGKRKILKRSPAVTVTPGSEAELSEFIKYLKTVILDGDFFVSSNRDGMRIHLGTSKYYISLIGALKRRKIPYFTYAGSKRKVLEVVIRGLPFDTNKCDIEEELTNLGYKVKYVMQLDVSKPNPDNQQDQPVTVREKTPLFLVVLENTEESKSILDIKQLLYFPVKVEKRLKKEIPVQCRKCQRFGHTGTYCQCRLRCVKCAGEHGPKRCSVKGTKELRCANCSGTHPASYYGCVVYKQYVDGMKKIKKFGSVKAGTSN